MSVCVVVVGLEELLNRVESTLEGAFPGEKRVYSSGIRLRRDMEANQPVFELFVSGSSTGLDKFSIVWFVIVTYQWNHKELRSLLAVSSGSAIGIWT